MKGSKPTIAIPCEQCNGKGYEELSRYAIEVILSDCRKPGATYNEMAAAHVIEQLLSALNPAEKSDE